MNSFYFKFLLSLALFFTVSAISPSLKVPGLSTQAFAQSIESQVELPFLLPQTNFFIGTLNKSISLSSSGNSYDLNAGGLNVYGFDIEVNANSFMNIGAYMRVESLGALDQNQTVSNVFATYLGGFARFFYVPPFLRSKTGGTNIFARLEAGPGAAVLIAAGGGVLFQGGAHVGVETYLNRWIGASLSYGGVLDWGVNTIVKSSHITAQGTMLILGLKTTFF